MRKHTPLLVVLGILSACTHEWRTQEPVIPSTYETPSNRSATSIGRLSRLIVLPAIVHLEADDRESPREVLDKRSNAIGRELQTAIADFLVMQKGYEVRVVDAPAATAEPSAIREAGRQFGVDGVVVVERWIAKPWSTAKGIMNVFMLNIPLFQALSAVNLRISIYETGSGRLVWQRELKGEDVRQGGASENETGNRIDVKPLLGDLENAVPPQLRR